jgi:phosphoribosyl 1,2-cyclic phosphate phosphodiesterase
LSRKVTILGCGSSGGVPRVAQGWGECDPGNPRNRRRRCAILVEQTSVEGVTTALVDTSPDLREQLLDAGVARLDGVLMTHSHADHTHGMDDLRPLYLAMRRRIDIHMDDATSQIVRRSFAYLFESPVGSFYPPILNDKRMSPRRLCSLEGPGGVIEAMPFDVEHGETKALGFRIGDLAYTPDLNAIGDESLPFLQNLSVWIIDALRYRPHPSHLTIDEALGWIEKMRPRRAIITNMHTDLDYETLARRLPANVEPAYDGLVIEGSDGFSNKLS